MTRATAVVKANPEPEGREAGRVPPGAAAEPSRSSGVGTPDGRARRVRGTGKPGSWKNLHFKTANSLGRQPGMGNPEAWARKGRPPPDGFEARIRTATEGPGPGGVLRPVLRTPATRVSSGRRKKAILTGRGKFKDMGLGRNGEGVRSMQFKFLVQFA